MSILQAYNTPFAAAIVLMALLALAQIAGLGDLFGDSELDFDTDIDGDAAISNGLLDGLFSLIGLGRVPLTVWLALFLGLFAGIGVGFQSLAIAFLGGPMDRWAAAALAALAAVPVTGALARPLGRILPHDETSAVSIDTLVGRRARITDGIARAGSPARACVHDAHGQPHYVMVEPHEERSELHAGDEVLLVRRDGNRFYATALAERLLSPN